MSTTAASFTVLLERVRAAPLEQVQHWAAEYLKAQEHKREKDRKYCASEKSKTRYRKYYFTSKDIYHPQLNPGGTHEKKWKREHGEHHVIPLLKEQSRASQEACNYNDDNDEHKAQPFPTSCDASADADAPALMRKGARQSNWRFAACVLQAVEVVARTHTAANSELVDEADSLENLLDSRFKEARLPMQPVDVCIVDLLPRIRTLLTRFLSSELCCCAARRRVCATIAQLDAHLTPE